MKSTNPDSFTNGPELDERQTLLDDLDELRLDGDYTSSVGDKVFWALSWLVTILIPVVLLLTAVRFLVTPIFVQLEYRTPNFPPDPYGFTLEDRLYWSRFALNYLLNDEGISYLGDLRFQDGTPVYDEAELTHMVDAKNVFRSALFIWYGTLVVMLILGVWAWRGDWWDDFCRGLARGGWLTVILVGLTTLFVLIGFGFFFVAFHEVLFDPGTWTFAYSTTLIRLFPERFWRDTFLTAGILSIGGGLALAMGFRRKTKY